MNKNNNPDPHPKIYIALDKAEIKELKQRARNYIKENKTERAEGILESIEWITDHDIYTRPWSTK
jgi:hypothetical protein